MNGTFEIKSQTNNSTYEYKDENLIVQGQVVKDGTTGALQTINGSCYAKDAQGQQGTYVGNFNGYVRDGEVRYTLSEMSRRDSNKVWDAIDEIEAAVIPQENAE